MVKNDDDAYLLKNCHFLLLNMTTTKARKTKVIGKTRIYDLSPCQGSTVKHFFYTRCPEKKAKKAIFEAPYS